MMSIVLCQTIIDDSIPISLLDFTKMSSKPTKHQIAPINNCMLNSGIVQ
jgi:hypothetical protein